MAENTTTPQETLLAHAEEIFAGAYYLQAVVGLQQSLMYPEGTSAEFQLGRALEQEVPELEEAIDSGSREEIGDEAADVIIGLVGLCAASNVDVGTALIRKLHLMIQKYDTQALAQLRASGLSQEEAVVLQKLTYGDSRPVKILSGTS